MWTRTVAQENLSDHGLKDEVRFREASSKLTNHEKKMLTEVRVRIKPCMNFDVMHGLDSPHMSCICFFQGVVEEYQRIHDVVPAVQGY